MACIPNKIAWDMLAANIKFVCPPLTPTVEEEMKAAGIFLPRTLRLPKEPTTIDLVLSKRLNQRDELLSFAESFVAELEASSMIQRSKYPEYNQPNDDEVVIDDKTAREIWPTIYRFRSSRRWHGARLEPHEVPKTDLSHSNRLMSFWLRSRACDVLHCSCDCSCGLPDDCNSELELIKILIYHNRLDILLRISSHPSVDFPGTFWSLGHRCGDDFHINLLSFVRLNLDVYMCFNVLLNMPYLHNSASRNDFIRLHGNDWRTSEQFLDYRLSKAYQKMVIFSTGDFEEDTQTLPHRDFHGILPDTFLISPASIAVNRKMFEGSMSYIKEYRKPFRGTTLLSLTREDFKNFYVPSREDVLIVRSYLYRQGLPLELCFDIMERARYEAQRSIPVAGDPLHPANREELSKYLDFCWGVLVNCDVLMKAGGKCIDWDYEVLKSINYLFVGEKRD